MAKKAESKPKTPFTTLVKDLPTHDFSVKAIFTGCYVGEKLIKPEEGEDFSMNIFADIETGEEVFIKQNFGIQKAIEEAKAKFPDGFADIVFQIEFLGKTEVKGKPFNQWNIGCCPLEAYQDFKKE